MGAGGAASVHVGIPPSAPDTPPPDQAPPLPADGYCCGRYASYWNVFLFCNIIPLNNLDTELPARLPDLCRDGCIRRSSQLLLVPLPLYPSCQTVGLLSGMCRLCPRKWHMMEKSDLNIKLRYLSSFHSRVQLHSRVFLQ